MNTTSFAVKASLIASMILSGQAFAQSLPDEINHPQYLRIYQGLEQILAQKTAEYNKLALEKAEIEKTIAAMEKDQVELPARNNELQRLIANRKADIERINGEIQGLEGVLAKVIEDLKRLDNVIAQLQRDLSDENGRSQQIQARRNQAAQVLQEVSGRLQREVNEENQSIQVLNRLTGEMNATIERRQQEDRERAQLIRDVERFRGEIGQARNNINQNNAALAAKRPQLADAQARLPGVRSEIAAEEAKLTQIDAALNPKRSQLNALKAELGRLSPDIARLQNENNALAQKIAANDAKIGSLNVNAQIARRDSLEAEVAPAKNKIKSNTDAQIALQEKIKPVIAQLNDLANQMRQAAANRNHAEVTRIKAQMDALQATIAGDQREIMRITKENEALAVSIAAKQGEINNLNSTIANVQNQIAALQNENNASRAKIAENDRKITEQSQANAGLAQQIAALENEVRALEAQRDPSARKVTTLRQQESQLTGQINGLSNEIQRLEAEARTLTQRVAEMERAINEFPNNLRRLEAHIRQLDEKVIEIRQQIDREQRLLARIRQDRATVQAERDRAQMQLDQINQDLANSQRLIATIQNKLNEESANRSALARYNQDSVRKLETLQQAKANDEKDIADASQEISINNQDIDTIASQLPKLRSDLSIITPKVVAAEKARNTAQTNVTNANDQYQTRLSLYQQYLTEAQTIGSDRAAIGTADGIKAGSIDAKTKANKLGSESASNEGKWEAIRRGYVRGEIDGFKNGFDLGMASLPDAQKGQEDGQVAGARRAKDEANLVIKPERYLEELERRLKDDETSALKPMMASLLIKQEISNIKAMSRELEVSVPDLSQGEIADASRIVSSLDALIAQSDVEIREIRDLRKKLADARSVYATPGAGENANNANCTGVYKNVKDFIEACKGAYVIRYQNLYNSAHSEAFTRDYGSAFKEQIARVFETELNRLYPGYFKEASNVGKEVGISTGKKEIYQQSFARAESATYASTLPGETARVENEAVKLVQEHLNQNAALTLKARPKLITSNIYGMAPGSEADLKMLIKNVGSEASSENSIVRITQVSGNLSLERREAPITTVAPHAHSDLSVMKVRVNDTANPGSTAVIAGEIIHPGNHYRASRVENFRVESVLNINPSIDASAEYDTTPNISVIFVTKKHDIDLKIRPKYAGVDRGYEAVLEEVGTNFVEIVSRPAITELLGRGVEKKVTFTYKLNKAAKGKTLTLKLTVKNGDRIVSEQTLQIKPE